MCHQRPQGTVLEHFWSMLDGFWTPICDFSLIFDLKKQAATGIRESGLVCLLPATGIRESGLVCLLPGGGLGGPWPSFGTRDGSFGESLGALGCPWWQIFAAYKCVHFSPKGRAPWLPPCGHNILIYYNRSWYYNVYII